MARMTGAARRQQIVEATLTLLATIPVATLTTRQIAAEVGVSQPALFRHFDSREDILLAAVSQTRSTLREALTPLLASDSPVDIMVSELAVAILGQLHRTPGIARLLFAGGQPGQGRLHAALGGLVDQQKSVVAGLVAGAQARGELRASVDPTDVGTLFVGAMQGLVLRAHVADGPLPPPERAHALIAILFDGLRPSATIKTTAAAPPPLASEVWSPPSVCCLDVRPQLARGEEPFAEIQAALRPLSTGDLLVLEAPFQPRPLLSLLQKRGHGVHSMELSDDHHVALVRIHRAAQLVDLSDLPAPEPLEATLRAAAALQPGTDLLARTPRMPQLLAERLPDLGTDGAFVQLADGSGLALIWRPT